MSITYYIYTILHWPRLPLNNSIPILLILTPILLILAPILLILAPILALILTKDQYRYNLDRDTVTADTFPLPDELSVCKVYSRDANSSQAQDTALAKNTLHLVVNSARANDTGNYTCAARHLITNELVQSQSLFISVGEYDKFHNFFNPLAT